MREININKTSKMVMFVFLLILIVSVFFYIQYTKDNGDLSTGNFPASLNSDKHKLEESVKISDNTWSAMYKSYTEGNPGFSVVYINSIGEIPSADTLRTQEGLNSEIESRLSTIRNQGLEVELSDASFVELGDNDFVLRYTYKATDIKSNSNYWHVANYINYVEKDVLTVGSRTDVRIENAFNFFDKIKEEISQNE